MFNFRLDNVTARSIVAAGFVAALASHAVACPFCTVESRTLTEEINSSDAVVLAKLVEVAPPLDIRSDTGRVAAPADPDAGKATFEVLDVLRGEKLLAKGARIKVVYFGELEKDKSFLISGVGTDDLQWTTPLPLTPTAVQYVRQLQGVATAGADRLAFFQEYLENDDPLLAQDAYDEFARAPYSELHELKPRMHHDQLVAWITGSTVNPSRRRLYLTMLGVCGSAADVPMLEGIIRSDFSAMKPMLDEMIACGQALNGPIGLPMLREAVDLDERRNKLGLDAVVACYLTLHGPDGLDLVDDRFLRNPHVEYAHCYSTIMALRFHGESTDVLPRPRLLQSMRLLLDNPDFADQIIPDLARWDDWSVLDRLVGMFKADDEKSHVRQPVVAYLTVGSEQPGEVGQHATTALAELEQQYPEAVKQGRNLMAFGFLARARGNSAPAAANGAAANTDKNKPNAAQVDLASAGFDASAADIAAAEKVDPNEFPDPASYNESPASQSLPPEETATDPPADAQEHPATTKEGAGAETAPAAKPLIKPAPPAIEPYRLSLVIGVPLAAAVLLVGLYWLILRSGPV